jgi:hypothetical protein
MIPTPGIGMNLWLAINNYFIRLCRLYDPRLDIREVYVQKKLAKSYKRIGMQSTESYFSLLIA